MKSISPTYSSIMKIKRDQKMNSLYVQQVLVIISGNC